MWIMTLSKKNITLILGIAVAIFVGVSAMLFTSETESKQFEPAIENPIKADSAKIKTVSFDLINLTIQKSKAMVRLFIRKP